MAYEMREGTGTLFRNRGKDKNPRAPDWRGDALFNGVVLEISAWEKEGAKGRFFSLAVKVKEQRQPDANHPPRETYKPPAAPNPPRPADLDDDIPF